MRCLQMRDIPTVIVQHTIPHVYRCTKHYAHTTQHDDPSTDLLLQSIACIVRTCTLVRVHAYIRVIVHAYTMSFGAHVPPGLQAKTNILHDCPPGLPTPIATPELHVQ